MKMYLEDSSILKSYNITCKPNIENSHKSTINSAQYITCTVYYLYHYAHNILDPLM